MGNHLVTTGVYACVRNPIYSAFLIACTGALMIYGNLYLFVLPLVLKTERNMSVAEIAGRVEYGSPSKFAITFRGQMGMSSVEYRTERNSKR